MVIPSGIHSYTVFYSCIKYFTGTIVYQMCFYVVLLPTINKLHSCHNIIIVIIHTCTIVFVLFYDRVLIGK